MPSKRQRAANIGLVVMTAKNEAIYVDMKGNGFRVFAETLLSRLPVEGRWDPEVIFGQGEPGGDSARSGGGSGVDAGPGSVELDGRRK